MTNQGVFDKTFLTCYILSLTKQTRNGSFRNEAGKHWKETADISYIRLELDILNIFD